VERERIKRIPKECNVLNGNEESSSDGETEGIGLVVAPESIAVCKTAIEEQSKLERKK